MGVDPFAPETVYAATLTGLYKSTSGGQHWIRMGESLPDQMISAMVLDQARRNVIYLASRQGIYRSMDAGVTWAALNQGLDSLNVRSLVQSATDRLTWYAGTNGSGLYRSSTGGESWERVPDVHQAGAEDGKASDHR